MVDMNKLDTKACYFCRGVLRHPMLIMIPSVADNHSLNIRSNQKLLIAAQMKCSCREGIGAEHDCNGADLSDMTDRVRGALLTALEDDKRRIPVIDPENINDCGFLTFIVAFDLDIFKTWLALDLISVDMFDEYIRKNQISIERVAIPA